MASTEALVALAVPAALRGAVHLQHLFRQYGAVRHVAVRARKYVAVRARQYVAVRVRRYIAVMATFHTPAWMLDPAQQFWRQRQRA